MRHRRFARSLVVPCLAFALARGAVAAPVYDQSDVANTDAITISVYYIANDFTVAASANLTRATIWVMELGPSCGDGTLNDLNASLGWGVYTDSAGAPGTEVASGVAVSRVVTDTGFNAFGCDVYQVRFELGEPVIVAPGTYWFAIHDGAWGTDYDNSNVFWVNAAAPVGSLNSFAEASEVNPPQDWDPQNPGSDQAFVIEGQDLVWDQSPYTGAAGGSNMTGFSFANDFVLAAPATVSALDAWIEDFDSGDNGVINYFSGELGWAIFDNDADFDVPGTRLAEGHATATVTDTGFQSDIDTDTARASIDLGEDLSLPAGTYWLGLHENDWLADNDGSAIRLGFTSAAQGFGGYLSEPTADNFNTAIDDGTFRLWGAEPLFASGFERGTTCAWQPATAGTDCP